MLQSAAGGCKQSHFGAKNLYNPVKISLNSNCGVTGSITIPSVTESGSDRAYGMLTQICENAQPIVAKGRACPKASWNPAGVCKRATSTFWYMTIKFKAVILNGSSGDYHVVFNSNAFPIVFTSSAFITPGKTYGLCVLASDGTLIQDDFTSGNAVNPSGNTINLQMVLTTPYLSFDYEELINLYLESKPAKLE